MPEKAEEAIQALDTQYRGTIESHKAYLKKLQDAFDRHADEIEAEANAKLTDTPEEDEANKQQIEAAKQEKLTKALAELNQEIRRTQAAAYKKLEEIDQRREALETDLATELSQVEDPKKINPKKKK